MSKYSSFYRNSESQIACFAFSSEKSYTKNTIFIWQQILTKKYQTTLFTLRYVMHLDTMGLNSSKMYAKFQMTPSSILTRSSNPISRQPPITLQQIRLKAMWKSIIWFHCRIWTQVATIPAKIFSFKHSGIEEKPAETWSWEIPIKYQWVTTHLRKRNRVASAVHHLPSLLRKGEMWDFLVNQLMASFGILRKSTRRWVNSLNARIYKMRVKKSGLLPAKTSLIYPKSTQKITIK